MKKIIATFVAGLMMFSLAACGADFPASEKETSASVTVSQGTVQQESDIQGTSSGATLIEDNSESESTESKALVVYFSWSGNTESVANEIQSQTKADIFKIVPEEPYSDDYNTVLNLAREEQSAEARPKINGSIDNIEQYNTVYVGFPNWWGDMPMILYTFFDTYDLSGKTILPFCTSSGSGLSNTIAVIESLEPEATVGKGLHIEDAHLDNIKANVEEWLMNSGM